MYYVALFGRFVYGLGGESMLVAQNAMCVRWFSGPNLAFLFAITLAFARVGSALNFIATPVIAEQVPATALCQAETQKSDNIPSLHASKC